MTKVKCENCHWTGDADDCGELQNIHERVEPGEIMPYGECPECGCVCHEHFTYTHPDDRCGECEHCKHVETTKSLILADSAPAGPGLGDSHVRMWNKILLDNPCLNPQGEQRELQFESE
jgi:hypothetical protein